MIDKTQPYNELHHLDLTDKTPRILKCDGTEVPFPPKNGKTYDFTEIQEALKMEGNKDPLFAISGKVDGMMMVAEDNGYALELPENPKATAFYCFACGLPPKGHIIVGNTLIFPEEMME